jgi:hypothetical protein
VSVTASLDEVAPPGSASRAGGSASRPESTKAFAPVFREALLTTPAKSLPIYRVNISQRRTKPNVPYSGLHAPNPTRNVPNPAPNARLSNTRSFGTEATAAYSEGFADSTKDTAMISPPDRGTSSPLDWTPGLGFGFPDFQQSQFLNPTLHISAPRRGIRASPRNGAPKRILNAPALSTSIDEQVGLKAPSAQRDILGKTTPSASTGGQLGLQ